MWNSSYNNLSSYNEDLKKESSPSIHGVIVDTVNKSIEVKECGESTTSMFLSAFSRSSFTGATCKYRHSKKKMHLF